MRVTGARTVDLNTFSWFYTGSQLGGEVDAWLTAHTCLHVCVLELGYNVYEGTPWIGARGPEGGGTPDSIGHGVGAYGFFVARPFLLPASLPTCSSIEVMHVHTEWAGSEVGASWFYHTVGSGVFLDCADLPTTGRVAAYESRAAFARGEGSSWPGDGSAGLAWYMQQHAISMIVITEATYGQVGNAEPRTIAARTEIIVRQATGGSEGTLPSRSCLAEPQMGFRFKTGLDAATTCVCEPAERVNCDATVR